MFRGRFGEPSTPLNFTFCIGPSAIGVINMKKMRILTAFDKFKDSMTATRACEAAESGIRSALGDAAEVKHAPLTDGGEGFCRILTEAADGHIEYYPASGPLGDEIDAPIGWVEEGKLSTGVHLHAEGLKGRIAIIEMASVAGLEQVPFTQRHPHHCSTRGVGELIRIAVAKKADAILLGIGGSATSDLGLGALESMGLRFEGAKDILPKNWPRVTGLKGRLDFNIPPIYIARDVDNPLLGPHGAAAIYGPQKGMLANEVKSFDAQAKRMAKLLCQQMNQPETLMAIPGCGAAGGIGFGLKVACEAKFVPGFELVEAWLNLPEKIAWADLILTGEGKFDLSSLSGKGPYALLLAARENKKAALLLAGALDTMTAHKLRNDFPQTRAYAISPECMELNDALARGPENLELTVFSAVNEIDWA